MTIKELYYARKYLVDRIMYENDNVKSKQLSRLLVDVDNAIEGMITYMVKKPESRTY
jgi:hypothetical protein